MRITIFCIIAASMSCGSIMADNIKKDPKELLDSQLSMVDDLIGDDAADFGRRKRNQIPDHRLPADPRNVFKKHR